MAVYTFDQALKRSGARPEDVKSLGVPDVAPKQAETPSFRERAGTEIQKAGTNVYNAITGQEQYAGQSPVRRGVEATAEAFTAPTNLAYQALPEGARTNLKKAGEEISKVFSMLTDKVASTKLFKEIGELEAQGYINEETAPELKRIKDALGTAAAGGKIADNILAVQGGVSSLEKIKSKTQSLLSPKQPTITVAGKTVTIDQIHNDPGIVEWVKSLPEEQAKLITNFDNKYSLLSQIKDLNAKGKDVSDLVQMYEGEFGKLPPSVIPADSPGAIPRAIDEVVSMSKNITGNTVRKGEEVFDSAYQLSRPKVTKQIELQARNEGRIEAKGKGIFRKETITPSTEDIRVAESIQPLVEQGRLTSKMAPSKAVEEISLEVNRINKGVKSYLAEPKNNVPFNRNQLNTNLQKAKDGNRLLFADDATAQAAYDIVIDEFSKYVKTNNLSGLFEARQTFDAVIRNNPKLNKLTQKGFKGEINPISQAIIDVRSTANDIIANALPANNPFRALLFQESNMLKAIRNINDKALGTAERTAISNFVQKNPWTKGFLTGVIGSTGTGLLIR